MKNFFSCIFTKKSQVLILLFLLYPCLSYPMDPGYDKYKVVVMLPFSKDDLGFSGEAYKGIYALRKKGYTVDYMDNVDFMNEQDFIHKIYAYHEVGFNVFIGVGKEFSDRITKVASDYKDSYFVLISGASKGDNVVNYCLDCYPYGGELAGVVAASISKTGVVGFVGGVESVDKPEALCYKETILKINPNIKVLIDWTGEWDNKKLEMMATEKQVMKNVDVVVSDAGSGPIYVARRLNKPFIIGWMADQSGLSENMVVTNVIIRFDKIYTEVINNLVNGKFTSGTVIPGFNDSFWEITPLGNMLSAEQKRTILKTTKTIKAMNICDGN